MINCIEKTIFINRLVIGISLYLANDYTFSATFSSIDLHTDFNIFMKKQLKFARFCNP